MAARAAAAAADADADDGDTVTLSFTAQPFDLAFHPRSDVAAVALVDGKVQLVRYGGESGGAGGGRESGGAGGCGAARGDVAPRLDLPVHADAVRSVAFSADGALLFSGSTDRSVRACDAAGRVAWQVRGAHGATVTRVAPFGDGSGHLVASGDEDGAVKVWDCRAAAAASSSSSSVSLPSSAAAMSFSNQEDAVADLCVDVARATLLSASCDGTLGVYDLRKGRLLAKTEQDEDELLSVCVIKGGQSVIVGTQGGVLQIWKWGRWTFGADDGSSDQSSGPDRFTGHPESIDALLAVDDDTVVTGSSDGILRLLTVRPNKLVGVLGEHGDFPVERLAWSRDRRLLGSVSHDMSVKLWDVAYLFEDDDDAEEGGAGSKAGSKSKSKVAAEATCKPSKFVSLPALVLPAQRGDEKDDEEEEEEDEEEEEEEAEVMDDGRKQRKQPKAQAGAKGKSQKNFFKDM